MKKINLFIDMDGTVAKFYHDKKYLDKMFEQGYFENLKPYAIAKKINEYAQTSNDINIYMLTACVNSPWCIKEKTLWLKKYMPNVKHHYFISLGKNKAKSVEQHHKNEINILLDDYTRNLTEWEANGQNWVGIKFVNGINDKSKKWNGKRARTLRQVLQHISSL